MKNIGYRIHKNKHIPVTTEDCIKLISKADKIKFIKYRHCGHCLIELDDSDIIEYNHASIKAWDKFVELLINDLWTINHSTLFHKWVYYKEVA